MDKQPLTNGVSYLFYSETQRFQVPLFVAESKGVAQDRFTPAVTMTRAADANTRWLHGVAVCPWQGVCQAHASAEIAA